MKKYVVSEDIDLLRLEFSEKIPPSFFQCLRKNLKEKLESIFGEKTVEFVSSKRIREGLVLLTSNTNAGQKVVSLDRVYFPNGKLHIDMTRSVDEELKEIGETERYLFPSIENQILSLKNGFKKVVLVDDVVFSGNGAMKIIDLFRKQGMEVKIFIAGISVGEGKEKIKAAGVDFESVFHFPEVIDEICERDFYAGIRMSGRNVLNQNRNIGAPYFLPFGDPHKWASIPREAEKGFSKFCLKQSIMLWEKIEELRKRPIECLEIERLPIGAPRNGVYFLDYLKSLL